MYLSRNYFEKVLEKGEFLVENFTYDSMILRFYAYDFMILRLYAKDIAMLLVQ